MPTGLASSTAPEPQRFGLPGDFVASHRGGTRLWRVVLYRRESADNLKAHGYVIQSDGPKAS